MIASVRPSWGECALLWLEDSIADHFLEAVDQLFAIQSSRERGMKVCSRALYYRLVKNAITPYGVPPYEINMKGSMTLPSDD